MRRCSSGIGSVLAMLAGLAAVSGINGDSAHAQLVVTEIWQNGTATSTPDWFELTNFGSSAIDPSTLYYDDSSADPEEDNQLLGITNLAPGESAVYLVSWHDDFPGPNLFPPPFDPSDALAAFEAYWAPSGAYQIGYIEDPDTAGGPGLGGGGDDVFIFAGNTAGLTAIASNGYPDSSNEEPPDSGNGFTWVFDPFSQSMVHAQLGVAGAFASVDGNQVGSPGFAIPEPVSMALALFGAVAALGWRRGRSLLEWSVPACAYCCEAKRAISDDVSRMSIWLSSPATTGCLWRTTKRWNFGRRVPERPSRAAGSAPPRGPKMVTQCSPTTAPSLSR